MIIISRSFNLQTRASALESILRPPKQLDVINGATQLRIQALRDQGWDLHVVSHRVIMSVLNKQYSEHLPAQLQKARATR